MAEKFKWFPTSLSGVLSEMYVCDIWLDPQEAHLLNDLFFQMLLGPVRL